MFFLSFMKFDFVLFENLYTVENHYKDLKILAILLREAGYSVAIADAFKEAELCEIKDIPHIHIGIQCPKTFRTPRVYNQDHSRWRNLYYRIAKDFYLWRVIRRLKKIAPNIYMGSLTLDTPALFFSAFDKSIKYYMWALRSAVPTYWRNGGKGFYYYVSKCLYKNIQKYKNLHLIVSNDIIRNEFVSEVGVENHRIITRPERVISKLTIPDQNNRVGETLNILYIGTVRPSKKIELCMEALKRLNDNRIVYTIAGRCREDKQYGDKINRMASEMPNVVRIDRYIPDDEYETLLKNCDFVVLCDEKEMSCASNGTMSEALLHGKPIIAPDINPFKYEIEKYGIGFLYEYGNIDSLCETLIKALNSGNSAFGEELISYQQGFFSQNVASRLKQQISIK